MENGKLEKMKIIAYTNADMGDDSKVDEFVAMMNPETYEFKYKVEFNEGQGQGTSGNQQKYKLTKPDEFTFDFLFDNTGLIDGNPRDDVWDDVKKFKELLVDFDGSIHEPRHFKLVWGVSLFKGRLSDLSINFKLFKPDGTPIRAVAKATFKGSVEENLRVAKEDPQSPDLTHERMVIAGDHLSLMTHRIYDHPKYYLQVARANDLTNFRKLKDGATLLFPPVDKSSNTK